MLYVTRPCIDDDNDGKYERISIWNKKPMIDSEGSYNCYEEERHPGAYRHYDNFWNCLNLTIEQFEEDFGYLPESGSISEMDIQSSSLTYLVAEKVFNTESDI